MFASVQGPILNTYSCGINVVAQLVATLRYKPKSRAFDSRLGYWDFSWP